MVQKLIFILDLHWKAGQAKLPWHQIHYRSRSQGLTQPRKIQAGAPNPGPDRNYYMNYQDGRHPKMTEGLVSL